MYENNKEMLGSYQSIYAGKPEIPDGKSNGSSKSVWEASESIGCDLRRCNFCTLFSLFS